MKKLFLLFIIISFFSCKKEKQPTPIINRTLMFHGVGRNTQLELNNVLQTGLDSIQAQIIVPVGTRLSVMNYNIDSLAPPVHIEFYIDGNIIFSANGRYYYYTDIIH